MNFPQLLFMAGWVALSAPAALAVEPPMSGKASSGAASSAADKKAIASAMTAAPKKSSRCGHDCRCRCRWQNAYLAQGQ
ncbi:MAG: hypothetical protein RSA84_19400 [Acinetobacter sp.]|uniref:Uncharacterized protein n=1 Tax=Acinetobacter lwoffii NCTC 5866 = CIP 64.10 = NIPH 512 TaxID=981327 RepID=A0ABN0PYI1_ACILW|nr:hypothetical protein F995_01645 [Acinetobacter sp. CIP A162]ESJ95534.1 hypothetical protein P800_00342 [Acinetobacter lwoffii NCTC 5866 = CIP 64.10 = NIPH 512]SUU32010.1 Uncharacterised protein [Acinetobacter lwoffii]VFQ37454.1 Uncharacterised protein [Acinetobacter lwoffii]